MPLASVLIPSPNESVPLGESDLLTACPCGRVFRLEEAFVDDQSSAMTTTYLCPNLCTAPVLMVCPWDECNDPDAGWHFGDWALRNFADVVAFDPVAQNSWTKLTYRWRGPD